VIPPTPYRTPQKEQKHHCTAQNSKQADQNSGGNALPGPGDPEKVQNPLLPCSPVIEDPLIPHIVHGIPVQPDPVPGPAQHTQSRCIEHPSSLSRSNSSRTSFDTQGGDSRRGIHTHPSRVIQPHLGPCMGIGLPDNEIVAHGILFPSLIAHNHPGRNSSGTHQKRERGSVLLAVPPAHIEQKVVHGVVHGKKRRGQGVVKRLGSEVGQGQLHYLWVFISRPRPGTCQFPRPLPARIRKTDQFLQVAGNRVATARTRRQRVPDPLCSLHRGTQGKIRPEPYARRAVHRKIQSKHPEFVRRLRRHRVAHALPGRMHPFLQQSPFPGRPLTTVEPGEHQRPPVKGLPGRNRSSLETDPESDLSGLSKGADPSRGHGFRKSRDPFAPWIIKSP
jgi:hypothetical protein